MAETSSQIYIHIILVVKHRQHMIPQENREQLFDFISVTLEEFNQKPLAIKGTGDHLHVLFSLGPKYSLAEVVREIKSKSTLFIHNQKWIKGRFCWQLSYAAFSYSRSHLEAISAYIGNQEEVHRRLSCREEFIEFLKNFNIEFDEKYLFRFPEEEG